MEAAEIQPIDDLQRSFDDDDNLGNEDLAPSSSEVGLVPQCSRMGLQEHHLESDPPDNQDENRARGPGTEEHLTSERVDNCDVLSLPEDLLSLSDYALILSQQLVNPSLAANDSNQMADQLEDAEIGLEGVLIEGDGHVVLPEQTEEESVVIFEVEPQFLTERQPEDNSDSPQDTRQEMLAEQTVSPSQEYEEVSTDLDGKGDSSSGCKTGQLILSEQLESGSLAVHEVGYVLPECPVCLEICCPSKGRAVFSCPEGHTICGMCAPKVDRCPICRRKKSAFGGRFTRNRELEQIISCMREKDNNQHEAMSSIAGLSCLKDSLSNMKKELEILRDDIKTLSVLFSAKTKEVTVAIDQLKQAQDVILHNNAKLHNEKATTFKMDNSGAKITEMWCACALACPHVLCLDMDGRVCTSLCNCVRVAKHACLCVTHIITMKILIGGIPAGVLEIHLAARTNPRTVYRFYAAFKSNRLRDESGKVVDDVLFGGVDALPDSEDRDLLPSDRFWLSYLDGKEGCRRPWFTISMGGSHPRYRPIGKVVRGEDLVSQIDKLPTMTDSIRTSQQVRIQESWGWINTEKGLIISTG